MKISQKYISWKSKFLVRYAFNDKNNNRIKCKKMHLLSRRNLNVPRVNIHYHLCSRIPTLILFSNSTAEILFRLQPRALTIVFPTRARRPSTFYIRALLICVMLLVLAHLRDAPRTFTSLASFATARPIFWCFSLQGAPVIFTTRWLASAFIHVGIFNEE